MPSLTAAYRRKDRPVYLDRAIPITLESLHAALLAAAAREQWTTAQRQARWSYLRRAALAAIETKLATTDRLNDALELLPTCAPPPDGAGSVRKSLSILLGRPLSRRSRGGVLDPQRWQPMLDVLGMRGDKSRPLAALDLVCRAADYPDAPAVMPDTGTILATAKRLGIPSGTIRGGMQVYNKARGLLLAERPSVAKAFAPIAGGHGRVIGIEALPAEVVEPLLRAGGVTTRACETPWLEVVRIVAPVLHEEFTAWQAAPRRCTRPGQVTATGGYACVRAFNHLVAGLIRAKQLDALRTLSLLDIWTPSLAPFDAVSLDPLVRRQMERRGRSIADVRHAPARVAWDALAPLSRAQAGHPADATGWTLGMVRRLQNLWTLTGGVWRHRLLHQDPETWRDLERAFESELSHAWDQVLDPVAEKDIGTLLDLVSLPQLVCVGFPLLERQRARARALWLRAREAAAAAGYEEPDLHPEVKRAHANYARWAEVRLAAGIFVADGLRTANYRNGRLGLHYRFTARLDEAGAPCGLEALTTKWTGRRDDVAKTKREEEGRRRGGRRRRNRRTSPDWREAYVPGEALWQYLDEVALPRARKAGLLAADATVAHLLVATKCALFMSGSSRTRAGGHPLSATQLSVERVGYALWWTAKHALGRDLPEWEDLDRSGPFYRILSGHSTRNLLPVFWGTVMGDWEYAASLTNDRAETLRENYTTDQFARWEQHAGDPSHWDHPKAYAAWMVKLREKRLERVDLTDPALPLPEAARALLAQWDREDRRHRRGPTRAEPAGRVRRARPGQRPPAKAPPADQGIVAAPSKMRARTRRSAGA